MILKLQDKIADFLDTKTNLASQQARYSQVSA